MAKKRGEGEKRVVSNALCRLSVAPKACPPVRGNDTTQSRGGKDRKERAEETKTHHKPPNKHFISPLDPFTPHPDDIRPANDDRRPAEVPQDLGDRGVRGPEEEDDEGDGGV